MKTNIVYLDKVDSTNRFLKDYKDKGQNDMVVVSAAYQTAGKGQGSNVWESESGKNLLFSILVHPVSVPIKRQFIISMAIALAVKRSLEKYTSHISVKWPNDIYWNDKKICGILIENNISDKEIADCIIGVGLDVNQKCFLSDAPNPVSLYQILGHEVNIKVLLNDIVSELGILLNEVYKGNYDVIRNSYKSSLYRNNGTYLFSDKSGAFSAAIENVEEDGHLILKDTDGRKRKYIFKEVKFII